MIPGIDQRHPTAIAEAVAATLPHGRLVTTAMSDDLRTAEDLATAFEPPISTFLAELPYATSRGLTVPPVPANG